MNNTLYVLDTSIIINGEVTTMLQSGEISQGDDVVIPIAALDDFASQRRLPRSLDGRLAELRD